jgi:hypothetical protein
MKLIRIDTRIIISLTMICLLFPFICYSQGTDITAGKKKGLFIGFTIGPSRTNIKNTGTPTIAELKSGSKSSFSGVIDLGFLFSRYFGLSTGIGYSSYAAKLTLDTYENAFDTTDSEDETYERRISGNDIREIQKISFLNIPVQLNAEIPFGKTIGFFIQSGINFSLPLSKTYNSTGTFTYSGYYPAYNVLLTDIPYEGFKSNVKNDAGGELKLKSGIMEFISSAGFLLFPEKKLQFSLGMFYNLMLSEISGYSPDSSFRLSSKENNFRSMMEGSDKVSASSIGLKVSLRYYIQ